MATITTGDEAAVALLRALGIDCADVYRVEVVLEVGGPPRVTVHRYASTELTGGRFLDALRASEPAVEEVAGDGPS